jgi:hypothetical protein
LETPSADTLGFERAFEVADVDAAYNELVRPGSARRWSSPSIVF